MCDCAKYPNREQNKFTQFHVLPFEPEGLPSLGCGTRYAAADSLAEQLADVEAARHALKNGQQCSEKRGRLDLVI